MNPDESLLIAHLITEYALDIRLRNDVDPLLGRKLARAARGETKGFAALLTTAFAADYSAYCFGGDYSAAVNVLNTAEKEHRKTMIFLGQAISQSEPVAAQLLAEQLLVAHLITEYAIDIRLRNDADPLLGRKMARAARNETKRFPPCS